ncbi:MAG TPA: DUF1186 domain-containing protein [Rhizomicrobium sp.]|jgi:hypothetical protein|nr:DUF1186 domain-containing protein [Rhizomicrobium sp.]
MHAAEVFEQLGTGDVFPEDAIRAVRLEKATLVPEFINLIEAHAAGTRDWQDEPDLLLVVFHLLGEWREKSAYRPLLRFLRSPAIEALGPIITETSHRVIAAVFDGDTGPLRQLILDAKANELVRGLMLETMSMLDRAGEIRREEMIEFLRDCFLALQDEPGGLVWRSWQRAISVLGTEDLVPLVKDAFERRLIDPVGLDIANFEQELQDTLNYPDLLPTCWEPFLDTLEELREWYDRDEEDATGNERKQPTSLPVHVVLHIRRDEERAILNKMAPADRKGFPAGIERALDDQESIIIHSEPATNPHRNIGRNDPCPCGSSRKFKKCCLAQAA